jgi:hypothetical protein
LYPNAHCVIEELYQKGIFGQAVAYVYTIEFQKRGLPHMHILIFLKDGNKILTPADINTAIRAYWPDPTTEPKLFETVKRCMIHACNDRCLENAKCKKHFPKPFQPHTCIDNEGYPQYRRPDDGRSYEVNGRMVDNRWIVPHNPYLSAKFDCHINVECLVSFATLKYVNKYIHKGSDRATLQVRHFTARFQRNVPLTNSQVSTNDEIQFHIDSRFIGASEAVWRIFHFYIHKQVPNVVRLQVHLPGNHFVTFDPDEPVERTLARAAEEKTTLTAFFRANADPETASLANRFTYQEFPQHFVYNEKGKKWTIRKKGFAIGRMYFIPPSVNDERFYLRTLLAVVKGPKSYEDLRTFNGITHPTFREVCLTMGLLQDDGEWKQCLLEASSMQTGSQLRHLFATLLLFCCPIKPEQLWNTFRHHICDDLRYRLQCTGRQDPQEDEVFDFGLWLLEQILVKTSRKYLKDFPDMPLPERAWDNEDENPLIGEQLNYNRDHERALSEERTAQLNIEQRHAHDQVISSVLSKAGHTFFLNGPGGTGKTFVYNTICNTVRSWGSIVLCVASSGIAALLLRGGRTAHSMFKIPLLVNQDSTCPIPKEGRLASLIQATSLIIWDEITMQHRHAVEAVDRTCRDVLGVPDRSFGGITVVFGGDFQQILPVVFKGSREDVVSASLLRSALWENVKVLKLIQNMRIASDPDARSFSSWLLDIGHGRGRAPDETICLPERILSPDLETFINQVYPGIGSVPHPPGEYFMDRMILAPRNSDVGDLNRQILESMSGEEVVFLSVDSVVDEAGADDGSQGRDTFPAEFLRTLNPSGLPPGELRLKPGCPIILLRNLCPSQGLCNGTRMVVVRTSRRVLEAKVIGGEHHGETVFIPRITLTPTEGQTGFAFLLKRHQFPVNLAFALTINKAQGQSVKEVGIDLRVPVFSHGQLYVALSRATNSRNISILLPDADRNTGQTCNVVYPEVLVDLVGFCQPFCTFSLIL